MPRAPSDISIRQSVFFKGPLATYVIESAAERGIDRSEIIREAVYEHQLRRAKLIPRQGKPRRVASQAKIQLEERT